MTEVSAEMEEGDLSQNADQRNITYIHLVVFEKGAKTFYYDRCQVELKQHTIYVTPAGMSANKLWRTIGDNFVKHDYVICFFSSKNGFALIFDHKKHCKQVYSELLKKRVGVGNYSQLSDNTLERRFIIPMIKELNDYSELDFEFVFFILKFLRSLDIEQKQRLAPMIIETGIEQGLLDRILIGVDLTTKKETNASKNSKLIDTEDKADKKQRSATAGPRSSKQPKLVNQNESGEVGTESSSSSRKTMRVTFGVNKTDYYDNNEADGPSTPIKKPRLSIPSIPIARQERITTPFQIIDYAQCGVSKTHLFIFTDDKKTTCHEYNWDVNGKKFRCCGCRKRGPVARKDDDGNEQIYFECERCGCPSRSFNQEQYKNDIIVHKPNYSIKEEVSHLKKIKSKLYVYTSEDKKKAYKFDYEELHKRYICIKCRTMNHMVRAITCLNEDEEEFVSIQNKEHKCEPIDC